MVVCMICCACIRFQRLHDSEGGGMRGMEEGRSTFLIASMVADVLGVGNSVVL